MVASAAPRSLLVVFLALPALASCVTVVVTAATGKVGLPLFKQLVADGDGVDAVALVRSTTEQLQQVLSDGGDAIEVPDYCEAAAVERAFAQISAPSFRLYLACGNSPAQEKAELTVLRAAVATGRCEYIVKLSTVGAVLRMQSGGPYKAHLAVEAALKAGRVPHTILRPNMFMQMAAFPGVGLGGQLTPDASVVAHPYAERSISMVAAEDVARVAATLLRTMPDDDAAGAVLDLTGPDARSYSDLARIVSRLRPPASPRVTCEATSFEEHAPAAGLRSFLEVLGGVSEVTDEVRRVTGAPATSLDDFVEAHLELFGLTAADDGK